MLWSPDFLFVTPNPMVIRVRIKILKRLGLAFFRNFDLAPCIVLEKRLKRQKTMFFHYFEVFKIVYDRESAADVFLGAKHFDTREKGMFDFFWSK
jgi:hypothetical protein